MQFVEAGSYQAGSGLVDIRDLVRRAVQGTCSYPPDSRLPEVAQGDKRTSITVTNESTLVAARRFVDAGQRMVALNFASATSPGGGFLSGARAQEESLARSSALYACLSGNPMYTFHRANRDPIYTNYAIYSPDVPVIRTDEGTLLDSPWLCSFITSPAVKANAVSLGLRNRRSVIAQAMRERIHKVLSVAAVHGYDNVILGAWGCGAFGNDSEEVAGLFKDALSTQFNAVFANVVFAIMDWSKEQRFIGPFLRAI